MNNSFTEQIKSIPAFISLYQAYKENFNTNNFYVQYFMPPAEQITQSESGKSKIILLDEDTRLRQAQEALLSDNSGYFSEFVHDDAIREDVTEVIRFIFKEFYQC